MKTYTPFGEVFAITFRPAPPADRDESAVGAAYRFIRGALADGFKIIRTPAGFRVVSPAQAGLGFDITPKAARAVGWENFRV